MRKTAAIITVSMALLFTWSAQTQECGEETAKLLADDGTWGDKFGDSVSISGDTAVIGAFEDDDNGFRAGSAYIFTHTGGVWIEQAKLLPADGAECDWFGISVSISGDTAVIGAYFDQDNGEFSGSAYVFVRSEGVWTQQAKLLPADGAENDRFGVSVSISGDTAVIGAYENSDNGFRSGSAYVFTRGGGVWTEQAKLLPADGAEIDRFGISVSISGDTAVIGAFEDDDNGGNSGSAYVFTRSGGVWTQQAKLLPGDGVAEDRFGWSVSISGETTVIGGRFNPNGRDSGSAYVFSRSEGVWAEQAKLLPADGAEDDRFGWSVSISGDSAVIGAYRDDDNGRSSGSAYVFTRSGGVWAEQAKLRAADGAAGDGLGKSVCISGDTAVIGAPGDGDSGSAYVFDLGPCESCVRNPAWVCDGDVDGDGQVNPVDSGLVQASFGSTDDQDLCNYDLDCDGQINPVDAGIVQSLFATCEESREVCP